MSIHDERSKPHLPQFSIANRAKRSWPTAASSGFGNHQSHSIVEVSQLATIVNAMPQPLCDSDGKWLARFERFRYDSAQKSSEH